MKLGFVGLVLFVVAYVGSTLLYGNAGKGPHDLTQGCPTADGTTVTISLEEVQSSNTVLSANLAVTPGPGLLDPRTEGLSDDLSVVVTSSVTPTKRTWSKGMLPGVFPVPLAITGNVADWPFDHYRSGPITVELFSGAAKVPQRAKVRFVDSLAGWQIDIPTAGDGTGVTPYRLALQRSPSTAAFALLIIGVLVTIAGLALFVAVQTARDRRPFQPPMTTWYAAMLFAVVPLRNALPNAPPFGAWIDVRVVVWVIVVLVISMAIYISCWWRHLKPASDKPA
ncbi:DUF4436 domain-containing protein [Mycobacterium ulcerans]|uniref:DUF4436 domain-containing protein n=1 Tax=Mycobacterium ulcerans TaxID=1809 RepID=UPI0010690EFA|nr:DUF4436 domain-containing protein [Mycobacterium ulcerans]